MRPRTQSRSSQDASLARALPSGHKPGLTTVIVRAARDAGRTPSVALTSDELRQFETAFRQVSRSAFLLARQLGRSTEEAQDIVQEAALRGWRYRATRTGEFRPWFLTIVYRLGCRRTPSWLPLPANWDRPAADTFASSLEP